ncbi:hypothetical protein CHS0354_008652 [Potamilus streckersoni]|uniref:Calmodulin-binding domain-containing protein n=1 Tax=Potamilus streckersoni TaxID=2493646 RepID=A0AAE0THM6_9BIVA|nr:hypothetical protein CHS0354_008652 [Potamilus streckersoni]
MRETMEGSYLPLVNGNNWQYPNYVSTDNLIGMPGSLKKRVDLDYRKNLGYRLRRRKELINKRTKFVDISFALSLVGILAMIVDTELQFSEVVKHTSMVSISLRFVISLSTVGLLVSIVMYHLIGVRVRMVSEGLENWRLAFTLPDCMKLAAELVVCSFHPLPFLGDVTVPMAVAGYGDDLNGFETHYIPLNALLSMIMFIRIYLLGRFVVVHSALFCDTTVQSLGAMSNVNINTQFVFKALMSTMPGACLLVTMGTTILLNSWTLRMCEHYALADHKDTFFLQAMWITCVTFLTLGYGDIVPRTMCGRVIAIATALMGVGIMALCVAVLTKKLEQTRGQRHVHTFVQRIHLDKLYKEAASNVIKEALLVWRLKRRGYAPDDGRMIKHKKRLTKAVKEMNRTQFLKCQFGDSLVDTVEIFNSVNHIHSIADELKEDQSKLKARMESMEQLMANIHSQLSEMRQSMGQKVIIDNQS